MNPGEKVSHYEILKLLGKGGMGEVYLAHDSVLDRKVAIKFLPDVIYGDKIARDRFLHEAKAAAALDHPFICKIYETGESAGRSFIVLEYVEGETLGQKLAQGPFSIRDALQAAVEIAEALEIAHAKSIVHRDLKPSNVMCTPQGHIKVMDFGLAKKVVPEGVSVASTITQSLTLPGETSPGQIVGTIDHMSPEQAKGETIDSRSDIFSLGVILYELVPARTTGSAPVP
jgi:serine/threonine protein kinase